MVLVMSVVLLLLRRPMRVAEVSSVLSNKKQLTIEDLDARLKKVEAGSFAVVAPEAYKKTKIDKKDARTQSTK